MQFTQYTTVLIFVLIFSACEPQKQKSKAVTQAHEEAIKEKEGFPVLKSLNELKQTNFLPTLESAADIKKNSIYAASLLFAWDTLKHSISGKITKLSNKALQELNISKSYLDVLPKQAYQSSVTFEDEGVAIEALFKKSLPLYTPLERHEEPFKFLKDKVQSFGFDGYIGTASIVYYHHDDDFAIQLSPEDYKHEIVLIKTSFPDDLVLKDQIDKLMNQEEKFRNDKNDLNDWKYMFRAEDQTKIPVIEFNLETNFQHMEGATITTKNREYQILKARQKTAFILNEKGAEVESEAEIEADSASPFEEMTVVEPQPKPKPKKLFFDQPFLILLKLKKQPYPYFAMYVANSELMIKSGLLLPLSE